MAEQSHEEQLRALRERLYSRGVPPPARERRELHDEPQDVPVSWDAPVEVSQTPEVVPEPTPTFIPTTMTRKRYSFRVRILLAGLLFFVVALLLSGSFLLFGKNIISGDNILIETKGPFAVGGGDVLEATVSIKNDNAVPITSALVVLEYPAGTQTVEDTPREMTRDRKNLEDIQPGQTVEVPIKIRVFGEENAEQRIRASVEYRVSGSNAQLFKEAPDFLFKVSSSPVVLFIDNIKKSSTGQEIEISIDISSNAPGPIADLLLRAQYPQGFEYIRANQNPVSGSDLWSITALEPGAKKTLTITGRLTGNQNEAKVFRFSVGLPNERDRLNLSSVLTTQSKEVMIEDPFLSVQSAVNGRDDDVVAVPPGVPAQVSITLVNPLSSTLYDSTVVVKLSGSALDPSRVTVTGGFYDSKENTITWDGNSTDALRAIAPNRSASVAFTVTPREGDIRTPQIMYTTSVTGNRVLEDRVPRALTGVAAKTIKVESSATLAANAFYSTGAFSNTGPVPMQAEMTTTYSIMLYVKSGSNALADAVVTGTLPPYVTWSDTTTAPSAFSYNATTRQVSWRAGNIDAGSEREAEFQIKVRPSVTQVGQEIPLFSNIQVRAADRFTGSTLRKDAVDISSRLVADPQYESVSGEVAPSGG